ncbi:MAG: helix-hairpin-helix domain-containing protein [Deltaproteobacteria bacterium]|nr:helix-hairpin-helix domain-containing protein [Deltaproteobacteria bacterium]
MKHTRTCIKTLAIMLLLLFAAGPVLAEPPAAPSPAAKAQLQGTVNINTADATQLALLPGIGPKMAESIIAYRTSVGTFSSIEDMVNVKGIGPKSLEKMRPYLSVKGETTLKKG